MLGKKIRQLRKEHGLTQSELGQKIGVIKQTISSWENGVSSPSNEVLAELAHLFGVSTDYLLGNSDSSFSGSLKSQNVKGLPYWIGKTGMGKDEIAKRLGITQDLLEDYMSGDIAPPYNILISLSDICEVSTDCLIGIHEGSRTADLDNILPFRYNYRIAERIRTLCDKKNVSQEYLRNLLSLSENEVYYLIEYGFVPHMSTITKLADFFKVSCDYLLCQIEDQDEKAATAFHLLNEDNKDIIVGEIKKLLKEQQYESVAADVPLKKTGTDKPGK